MPRQSLTDYEYASKRINALKLTWEREVEETDRRRDIRYVNISTDTMRANGELPPDGVYIPRRIIHNNIRREQAPIVAYYTQSKSMAKFRPLDGLDLPVDELEREFTKFAQHDKWEMAPFETAEGAAMHGWDSIETVFDMDAPGHFRNRHIGHENLWFAWDITDIQHAPLVIVVHAVTTVELEEYVEGYDFDAGAAEDVRLKADSQEDKPEESRVCLLKVYFKEDFTVKVGWWCEHAKKWLKAPEPLVLGIGDQAGPEPETEYPISVLRYAISENMIITESKGRVFEDQPDQEACTQLATSYTNRAIRSQYLMFSPAALTDDPAQKQTEVKIKDGMVLAAPMKEFQIAAPNPDILTAMTLFINQNANEQGQVNFASKNNRDTRQTAAAVHAAQEEGSMLNSVQVVLHSMFWKDVLKRGWRIVRSQVQQGKLQSAIAKWEAYYSRSYTLLAAGDIDVIRRKEILMEMKQDWPVIQQTAAAQAFLEVLLRLSSYSEYADRFIAAMEKGNWKDNLLKGMANALQVVSTDPETKQLNMYAAPHAAKLLELKQEYEQVMTPQGEQPQEQTEQPEEVPA